MKQDLTSQEFKIKGMICSRCLKVLNSELKEMAIEVVEIELGRILIRYNSAKIHESLIRKIINENEFEIIWNKESIQAEQTKRWVVNYLWGTSQEMNLSEYLVKKLNTNYNTLSRIFSKTFGKSIERYSILLKIERAKELIENDKLSFSEISYELGYQNPSGLSRLFKKETGMTLKEYKSLGESRRVPIDRI
ncbi:AraC family transcriptional regulator [Imperialibacter roseus]|uniref:AraC family transcriptional regulator n=1 Tax=Imperialibacter roseus TaxID=1324217 RepID=A0ABZ0IT12_9BACT|nr:AraC family transcriptional regulator [Imperialibacter roseus]WOK07274.1 AraC family transcriptional regulator [Imperialibacter roseus]